MSGFLLDTNCISEVVKPRPEISVIEWMESTDESLLFLSVLTLAEIRKGVEGLAQGSRRTKLATWLSFDLRSRFVDRILSIDEDVAGHWGVLAARAKARGITLPVIDGLLAATALNYNLTIVSRNVADFTNAGVSVLNPWNA
jgi:predicted nucleic acid-binding protein